MGKPAARALDQHDCPLVTGTVLHVGGPILPPDGPTVFINSLPAARAGDKAQCVGPSNWIFLGSFTVLIGGAPAARVGDTTVHGGEILFGSPSVFIGD